MVAERNPIPDRPRGYAAHKCAGCGGTQDSVMASGQVVCAYCRSHKGYASRAVEITRLDDTSPRYLGTTALSDTCRRY